MIDFILKKDINKLLSYIKIHWNKDNIFILTYINPQNSEYDKIVNKKNIELLIQSLLHNHKNQKKPYLCGCTLSNIILREIGELNKSNICIVAYLGKFTKEYREKIKQKFNF